MVGSTEILDEDHGEQQLLLIIRSTVEHLEDTLQEVGVHLLQEERVGALVHHLPEDVQHTVLDLGVDAPEVLLHDLQQPPLYVAAELEVGLRRETQVDDVEQGYLVARQTLTLQLLQHVIHIPTVDHFTHQSVLQLLLVVHHVPETLVEHVLSLVSEGSHELRDDPEYLHPHLLV